MEEGKIWGAIVMGAGSEVALMNGEKPTLSVEPAGEGNGL